MRNKTKTRSRSPNDFYLGVAADKLACHTIQICKNPRVFDPAYNEYLIRDIIKYAKDAAIYILCANDIRVNSDQDRELRYKLQSKALWDYKCLRAHINMAARACHLRASKSKYWMSLTLEAENMLKAYAPGSQMVQIAGISYLDPLDHHVKEQLHIKYYLRYMDDFILIHHDREYLEYCRKQIELKMAELQLTLHPKKTRVYELKEGIKILGFTHRLTPTGKVIRIIDPKNVKSARKRFRRLVNLAIKGEIPKSKADECVEAWKAHARNGNSYKLLQRIDKYYKSLWREYADYKKDDNVTRGTGRCRKAAG